MQGPVLDGYALNPHLCLQVAYFDMRKVVRALQRSVVTFGVKGTPCCSLL